MGKDDILNYDAERNHLENNEVNSFVALVNRAPDNILIIILSRSQLLSPQQGCLRVIPFHPFNGDWPAEPLSRSRSENVNKARKMSIMKKWKVFKKKVLMLTLMMRGMKKKARLSEEEYMLLGLLRPQENRMALRDMARIFHP